MATLALAALIRENRLVSAVRKFVRTVATSVSAMLAGIAEARTLAARYEAMSRLSDAELSRRGLMRSDIPRVVLEGAAFRRGRHERRRKPRAAWTCAPARQLGFCKRRRALLYAVGVPR